MKRYPRVHQLGFVVRDLDTAMTEYGEIYGIRKWYAVVNDPPGKIYFRGREIRDEGYDMRVGYCGSTEIELITTSLKDNIYGLFLEQCGEGLHHVSFFVRRIEPYVDKYRKLGFEVVQNGEVNGKSMITKFAYMAKPGENFTRVVEVQDVRTKSGLRLGRNRFNIGFGVLTGDLRRVR